MIPDPEIWLTALELLREHGEGARQIAIAATGAAFGRGEADRAAVWRRIVAAIEQLQAEAPPDGVRH